MIKWLRKDVEFIKGLATSNNIEELLHIMVLCALAPKEMDGIARLKNAAVTTCVKRMKELGLSDADIKNLIDKKAEETLHGPVKNFAVKFETEKGGNVGVIQATNETEVVLQAGKMGPFRNLEILGIVPDDKIQEFKDEALMPLAKKCGGKLLVDTITKKGER